jgi:hypothetical protein
MESFYYFYKKKTEEEILYKYIKLDMACEWLTWNAIGKRYSIIYCDNCHDATHLWHMNLQIIMVIFLKI